jgi:release factor glutamine methyltransferase
MNRLPSIAACLRQALQLRESDSARLDVELLLAHVLQQSRTYLYTWPEKTLSEQQAQHFVRLLERRLQGEPVAHILGRREFWSLPLWVDKSTLIPRPDTELLVETALDLFAADTHQQPRKLLDLGTGTGAIALALASEKKHWQCLGVDKSPEAVALAEKNRLHLRLMNVCFMQSDWFAALPPGRFDLIVSNPPYIDPQDPHLQQGDVRFEPRSALVADNGGLADLQLIIAQAPAWLSSGGWLLVEHGYDQAPAVRELFASAKFVSINSRRDLGDHERVTYGQMPVN